MRAIVVPEYGPPDVMEPRDVEVPDPAPGEIRIDVAAIGVNFADVKRRKGTSSSSPTPPFTPGIEVAGTVDAVGDGVVGDSVVGDGADFEPGDRVVAYLTRDGYAEYVVADGRTVFPIPSDLSFDEAAAALVQFVTAHDSLHRCGHVTPEDRVLIHGAAGGVGSAAVQLGAGADATVFGTASTPEKLDLAAELGADYGINYEQRDFAAEIERLTDGEGVDLVLDGVGGATFERSVEALAPFGRLVSIGCVSGQEGHADPSQVRLDRLSIVGYHLRTSLRERPEAVRSTVETILSTLVAGTASPVLDEQFPLAEADRAHRYLEDRQSRGKLLLHP